MIKEQKHFFLLFFYYSLLLMDWISSVTAITTVSCNIAIRLSIMKNIILLLLLLLPTKEVINWSTLFSKWYHLWITWNQFLMFLIRWFDIQVSKLISHFLAQQIIRTSRWFGSFNREIIAVLIGIPKNFLLDDGIALDSFLASMDILELWWLLLLLLLSWD